MVKNNNEKGEGKEAMQAPNQIFLFTYFYSKLISSQQWGKYTSFFNVHYNFMSLVNQEGVENGKKRKKKKEKETSKLIPTLLSTWRHIVLVF